MDALDLSQSLIRCPSVTPQEAGAIQLLETLLSQAGFICHRADRNGIANLYARSGTGTPVFGFNGHTDVVPPGEGWSADPFSAHIAEGRLWGRGAADMKTGVAAFVCAATDFVHQRQNFDGSIAILITGDEEGDGIDGTDAILDWMEERDERLDVCLVGEPTCPERIGDTMKIGRRGSMTVYFTATGQQGHSAYPHRARNPLPPLLDLLHGLATWQMDDGTDHFDPSTLAVTTVDVGNPANNVIPGAAQATVNIRFNDTHSSASIMDEIDRRIAATTIEGVTINRDVKVSGESFVTEPGPFVDAVAGAVQRVTGLSPALSTSGGTSDARFIRRMCPVVEFGLVGQTMHKADENVAVEDIHALTNVYRAILDDYFA